MQICTDVAAVNQNHSLNICLNSSGNRFLTSTTIFPDYDQNCVQKLYSLTEVKLVLFWKNIYWMSGALSKWTILLKHKFNRNLVNFPQATNIPTIHNISIQLILVLTFSIVYSYHYHSLTLGISAACHQATVGLTILILKAFLLKIWLKE